MRICHPFVPNQIRPRLAITLRPGRRVPREYGAGGGRGRHAGGDHPTQLLEISRVAVAPWGIGRSNLEEFFPQTAVFFFFGGGVIPFTYDLFLRSTPKRFWSMDVLDPGLTHSALDVHGKSQSHFRGGDQTNTGNFLQWWNITMIIANSANWWNIIL